MAPGHSITGSGCYLAAPFSGHFDRVYLAHGVDVRWRVGHAHPYLPKREQGQRAVDNTRFATQICALSVP